MFLHVFQCETVASPSQKAPLLLILTMMVVKRKEI